MVKFDIKPVHGPRQYVIYYVFKDESFDILQCKIYTIFNSRDGRDPDQFEN